jgi:hypothetical protein
MVKKATPDFEKVKYRVGKKVEKPNESKLNFKAKRVQLASQSILESAPSTPEEVVTECLTRCRHYSARKRLEAFQDMRRMETLPPSLYFSIISTAFGTLIDEDADVRKIARIFTLQFISRSDPNSLSSFADVVSISLRSGLSHVDPGIRKDVIDVLRSLSTSISTEYLNALLRKKSAADIVHLLCEQKIKLEIVDVIQSLCMHLILPRAIHPEQWRMAALIRGDEDETRSVVDVVISDLLRLRGLFEKPPRAVDELLRVLGAEPAAVTAESRVSVKSKTVVSRNRTGGSFAALLEDF